MSLARTLLFGKSRTGDLDQAMAWTVRSAVIQELLESSPGIHLTSTTILHEAGGESWVLALVDEEPTRAEQAVVNLRVEDLLP